MNFWGLVQKIWEGFKRTNDKRTTHHCYHIVTDENCSSGTKKSFRMTENDLIWLKKYIHWLNVQESTSPNYEKKWWMFNDYKKMYERSVVFIRCAIKFNISSIDYFRTNQWICLSNASSFFILVSLVDGQLACFNVYRLITYSYTLLYRKNWIQK